MKVLAILSLVLLWTAFGVNMWGAIRNIRLNKRLTQTPKEDAPDGK